MTHNAEPSFEATSTTNWNGIELPLTVAGKIFRTGRGQSADDLVVATEVYIDVTDIR